MEFYNPGIVPQPRLALSIVLGCAAVLLHKIDRDNVDPDVIGLVLGLQELGQQHQFSLLGWGNHLDGSAKKIRGLRLDLGHHNCLPLPREDIDLTVLRP